MIGFAGKTIRIALLCLTLFPALALAADDTAAPVQHKAKALPETTAALRETITKLDQQLFASIFDDCNGDRLAPLVNPDFEFYHDKHGMNATTGAAFVDNIRAMCERIKTGEDYRARRELDAATSQVYAMNNYGALHTGVHRFYMLEAGKPEKLVEISRFSNLWQEKDGVWTLTRVLSYDHRTSE